MEKLKRVYIELLLSIAMLLMFAFHDYLNIPNPIQLAALKMLLVSVGLLHAHIARKILFPTVRVDWNSSNMTNGTKIVILMYIAIPYFYSIGG